MKVSTLLLVIISIIYSTLVQSKSQVLKEYVYKKDSNYKWTLNATLSYDFATVYVLELTSQQWMKDYSDNSIWKHWLTVCKPNDYAQNPMESANLHILDGYNQNWTVPTIDKLSTFSRDLCKFSSSITATLYQIPNQFIEFNKDGVNRKEDGIVAYTWRRAIDNNDSQWVSLLPQTKSAIRAMDAIQEFGSTSNNYKVSTFVVSGASKRGWTTFGTAMVNDKRVIAIVPMVIPVLNLAIGIESQILAYGNWSFALNDYTQLGLQKFFDTSYFKIVTDVVDPINYLDVLEDVPKFIMVAIGDEFFLPDSTRNFYSQIKGEKRLGLYQSGHNIYSKSGIAEELSRYFKLIANSLERPTLEWSIVYSADKNSGTINMKVVTGTPTKITIWSADTESKTRRDFRTFACTTSIACIQNITWVSTDVTLTNDNSYSITLSKPVSGWTGFYFEVEFSTIATVQSEFAIVPDFYPFPPCSKDECASGVPNPDDNPNSSSKNNIISYSLLIILFMISSLL